MNRFLGRIQSSTNFITLCSQKVTTCPLFDRPSNSHKRMTWTRGHSCWHIWFCLSWWNMYQKSNLSCSSDTCLSLFLCLYICIYISQSSFLCLPLFLSLFKFFLRHFLLYFGLPIPWENWGVFISFPLKLFHSSALYCSLFHYSLKMCSPVFVSRVSRVSSEKFQQSFFFLLLDFLHGVFSAIDLNFDCVCMCVCVCVCVYHSLSQVSGELWEKRYYCFLFGYQWAEMI